MSKRQDPIKRNTTLKLQRVPIVSTTQPIILDDHLASVPPESNSYLRQKEKLEYDHAKQLPADMQTLLPALDDPQFNTKLVQHAEFHAAPNDTVLAVEDQSNQVCSAPESQDDDQFLPHQLFVRQFLSPTSPYNSLLVYHSATANRFCAAIGVAEEWRQSSTEDNPHPILVITSNPDLFRSTLFQSKMLEQVGNDRIVAKWGCATEGLLRDVNPLNGPLSMDQATKLIQDLIQNTYQFQSPELFKDMSLKEKSLIILDQVIPPNMLEATIQSSRPSFQQPQQKLLLLSAFPMLKSPTEIIPLVNLMNANDGRGLIEQNEVFDKKTLKFIEAHKENGHYVQESGYDLLQRKLTGYVSYLRSDTPYTHALRLYPDVFAPDHVFRESTSLLQSLTNLIQSPFVSSAKTPPMEYPDKQIHGEAFTDSEPRLRHLPLYLTSLGEEQDNLYQQTLKSVPSGTSLQPLMEDLLMTYPVPPMGVSTRGSFDDFLVQQEQQGSSSSSSSSSSPETQYRYKTEDRIFSPERLPKFSGKFTAICTSIQQATQGSRILIVSTFVKKGLVPLAMALEEYGIAAPLLGNRPLIQKAATSNQKKTYVFLNKDDANVENEADIVFMDTSVVATTLRFNNIRQIHVLDPPTYLHRIEEMVACAIFPRSHCGLPFAQRNVEIYMHGSVSPSQHFEMADVYAYRILTEKAKAIGRVTRLMKKVAVDCLFQPHDFSVEHMGTVDKNRNVKIQSSTASVEVAAIGSDRPYSAVCDYMETCSLPSWSSVSQRPTYKTPLLESEPLSQITVRIRQVFQEKSVYPRLELLDLLQRPRLFRLDQVVRELGRLVQTKSDVLYDKYGRRGYLVQKGTTYAFQPVEITDTQSGVFERIHPVDMKPEIVDPTRTQKSWRMLNEDENEKKENVSSVQKREGGGVGGVKGSVGHLQKNKNAIKKTPNIALCVDVATGDSDVKLADPWYKTIREWFNELQLVYHMTPSQIRQIVVDHAIEVMPEQEQIQLLTRFYSKIHTHTTNPTDLRIRTLLDRRMEKVHHDDDEHEHDHVVDTVCRLGPRTFQQTSMKTWVKIKQPQDFEYKGGLDSHGHLQLWLGRRRRLAKDISKQDLLVLLEQESILTPDSLGKRKVTHLQLMVLVEVLLRHFQQQTTPRLSSSSEKWFS